jgi:hypothetical protein
MAFGYREATDMELIEAPIPLLVPSSELTEDQRAFIIAFLDCKTVTGAEKRSRIHHLYHYTWLKDDPNYFAAFTRAKQCRDGYRSDKLEDVLYERGCDGYDYEVLGKDGSIVKLRRHSDLLGMFSQKKLNHEFRENSKSEVNVQVNIDQRRGWDAAEWDKFRSLLK